MSDITYHVYLRDDTTAIFLIGEMYQASLLQATTMSNVHERYTTPVQPIPWIIFSRYDQTIFGQFSLQILQRRFSPCGQANGERGARGGRLSYRCLGWKLVNLYVDAVDGYDDTTA